MVYPEVCFLYLFSISVLRSAARNIFFNVICKLLPCLTLCCIHHLTTCVLASLTIICWPRAANLYLFVHCNFLIFNSTAPGKGLLAVFLLHSLVLIRICGVRPTLWFAVLIFNIFATFILGNCFNIFGETPLQSLKPFICTAVNICYSNLFVP